MGNGIGKSCHCFAGDGEISRRHNDVAVVLSDPLDEGLGHSFCYVRPDPPRLSYSSSNSEEDGYSFTTTAFRSISGASVSANTSTPLSTCLADLVDSSVVDRAASFASSTSFASIPLQPVPRCSTCGLVPGSSPIERGFMSGPMERGFVSGPIDTDPTEKGHELLQRVKPKKRRRWINFFQKVISSTMGRGHKSDVAPVKGGVNVKEQNSEKKNSGGCMHLKDSDVEYFKDRKNLQWAQGKAGEDRVQKCIRAQGLNSAAEGNESQSMNSDEILVQGEMDLDSNSKRKQGNSSKNKSNGVGKKWEESQSKRNIESDGERSNHSEVLKALSEALRKTEAAFLEIADKMGEDVYLMNVGDSRAVLAQEAEIDDPGPRKVHQDLKRINEEILSNNNFYFGVACGELPNSISVQLTTDHSTYAEEEVQRIRNDHPDDASAIVNDRVKGYLKVTRAFGVGFLKQPKWNEALLEMFRINYIGTSPYITCLPSLYHYRVGPKDRFMILSIVPSSKEFGIDFYELLDIPQGERRRYHDDVSIIIISLEGRIWRSSM
ncbi:hypothetical protein SLA2020_403830 [Shorea laevis]